MATAAGDANPPTAASRSGNWTLSLRSGEAKVLAHCVRVQADGPGIREHLGEPVPLSQSVLSKETGLSQPSVSRALEGLQARGILMEDGTHQEGPGHPTTLWRVTDDFYVIGINLRDDYGIPGRLVGVATTLDGRRLAAPEQPYPLGEGTVSVDRVSEGIAKLVGQLPKEEDPATKAGRLVGVGVSLGGHVFAGRVVCSHNLGWEGVALEKEVHRALSKHGLGRVPVIVENNANSFASSLNPRGRPPRRVVVIVDYRGIGCGLFLGKKLWQGDHGKAGELGHTPVQLDLARHGCVCPADGQVKPDCRFTCRCGKHGCLETVSTPQAIIKAVSEDLKPPAEVHTIEEAAALFEQKNPAAVDAFHFAGEALGYALANLVLVLDPQRLRLYVKDTLVDQQAKAQGAYFAAMNRVLDRYQFSEPKVDIETRPYVSTDSMQEQAAYAVAGDLVQRFLTDQAFPGKFGDAP